MECDWYVLPCHHVINGAANHVTQGGNEKWVSGWGREGEGNLPLTPIPMALPKIKLPQFDTQPLHYIPTPQLLSSSILHLSCPISIYSTHPCHHHLKGTALSIYPCLPSRTASLELQSPSFATKGNHFPQPQVNAHNSSSLKHPISKVNDRVSGEGWWPLARVVAGVCPEVRNGQIG